ncbi:MAG: class II aldolase/adducin family protein [Anaerolineae bacterium]
MTSSLSLDRSIERAIRAEICQVCALLYEKDLIAPLDGNVSVRWGDDGLFKGQLEPDDLVVTDMAGQIAPESVSPHNGHRPSGELRLHLECYRQRPDVRAVVHAHPPITTAFTVARRSLAAPVLPESLVYTGVIETTAYATPTSAQGPEVVRELIRDHDALALDRHGAVTVGQSAMDAFGKMAKVENTALVILIAHLLGDVRELPSDEVAVLQSKREEHLAAAKAHAEEALRGAEESLETSKDAAPADVEEIVASITAEVLRRLGHV